jgi:hypothetical protein
MRWRDARQQSNTPDDFCNDFFLAVCHQVDTCDSFHFPDLLDDFDADLDALLAPPSLGRPLHPVDQRVRDDHARDARPHEFGGFRGF